MLFGHNIAFVTTTYKRLDLFKKMYESLHLCEDINLIDNFYILDDGSEDNDLEEMAKLSNMNVIFNNYRSQPKNLNTIFSLDEKYIFFIEDDVILTKSDNYITKALSVLEQTNFGQIMLSAFSMHYHGINIHFNDLKLKEHYFEETNNMIYKYENNLGLGAWKHDPKTWPHFMLFASILNLDFLKSCNERFKEERHFERKFSYRVTSKGFKRLSFPICTEHIGNNYSTYDHIDIKSR